MSDATGSCVSLTGNKNVAVCFAGSRDGRALADSRRVLVLHLTDLKATGLAIEPEPKKKDTFITRDLGRLPLLVRQGMIEITFKTKDRPLPQVWALKYDGTRAAKITPQQTADGFSFAAQAVTRPEVFAAYELAWEPSN